MNTQTKTQYRPEHYQDGVQHTNYVADILPLDENDLPALNEYLAYCAKHGVALNANHIIGYVNEHRLACDDQ